MSRNKICKSLKYMQKISLNVIISHLYLWFVVQNNAENSREIKRNHELGHN